jgi:DedD protein
MSGLLDSDLEHDDDGLRANGEREISLGTATVLGIFFLIALVCAGCFGFGYMLGRKSNQADAAPTAVANNGSHTSKPGAGSTPSKPTAVPSDQGANTTSQPEIASPPASVVPAKNAAPPTPETATVEAPASQPPAPKKGTASVADFLAEAKPAGSKEAKTAASTPAKPSASTPAKPATDTSSKPAKGATKPATQSAGPVNTGGGSGNFMVQVAAVSSQDLADILLASLKKKGYSAVARSAPQDNFLHILIGPFANHKEAEQMRDRVIADGWNAIVKP